MNDSILADIETIQAELEQLASTLPDDAYILMMTSRIHERLDRLALACGKGYKKGITKGDINLIGSGEGVGKESGET